MRVTMQALYDIVKLLVQVLFLSINIQRICFIHIKPNPYYIEKNWRSGPRIQPIQGLLGTLLTVVQLQMSCYDGSTLQGLH